MLVFSKQKLQKFDEPKCVRVRKTLLHLWRSIQAKTNREVGGRGDFTITQFELPPSIGLNSRGSQIPTNITSYNNSLERSIDDFANPSKRKTKREDSRDDNTE